MGGNGFLLLGVSWMMTLVPGGASGVRLKLNVSNMAVYADNLG